MYRRFGGNPKEGNSRFLEIYRINVDKNKPLFFVEFPIDHTTHHLSLVFPKKLSHCKGRAQIHTYIYYHYLYLIFASSYCKTVRKEATLKIPH
jgi:hypothetical protein